MFGIGVYNIMTSKMQAKAELILKTAMDLSLKHGLHGWTMRQLTNIIKMPEGSIWLYVGSRDSVLDEISERVIHSFKNINDSDLLKQRLLLDCKIFKLGDKIHEKETI